MRKLTNDIYNSILNRVILENEQKALQEYLQNIFGYQLIQLGGQKYPELPSISSINQKIFINSNDNLSMYSSGIQSEFDALPLLSDSIDVAILPHTLELNENPKQILSEIYRILIGEGYVLIVGFNPFSLFGISHLLKFLLPDLQPTGLISLGTLRHMLSKIGFSLIDYKTFFFRPPATNAKILKKTMFLEAVGQILWPYWGNIYIIKAQKQTVTLTPIKQYVSIKKARMAIANPSTVQSRNKSSEL